MRYTTVIDITEYHEVYRNKNAVLLYLHLCLTAGYHSADRDILRTSLRRLSAEVGITLSACRNAVMLLRRHGLLDIASDGSFHVTKWCSPLPIPKREVHLPVEASNVETEDERKQRMQDDTEKRLRAQLDGTPETHEILMLFLYDKAKSGDKVAHQEAESIRFELEKVGYHSKWL